MNTGPTGPQHRAQVVVNDLEKREGGVPVWLWIVIAIIIIILILAAVKNNRRAIVV